MLGRFRFKTQKQPHAKPRRGQMGRSQPCNPLLVEVFEISKTGEVRYICILPVAGFVKGWNLATY